jgi:isopentenyldiphosphate isomerase
MTELWQLYDEQGRPVPGRGATKPQVFTQGLLHAAAHVWIWRRTSQGIEVLLQRRAQGKRTWPGLLDVSAAGHILLGEHPLAAALREAQEEIGLAIKPDRLRHIGVHRMRIKTSSDDTEYEFQWLYTLELTDVTEFRLRSEEVSAIDWKAITDLKTETMADATAYVPHGRRYFETVISAIN